MRGEGMDDSRVMFCPFCHEPFEGIARCPSHDLALVEYRELSRSRLVPEDAQLPLLSLQGARGFVLMGALVTLLAFFLPMARLSGQVEAVNTLRELASRAPRLWLVPAAALAALSVLVRRRSPVAMRSARLALGMLALIPSAVVGFTLLGTHEAAVQMSLDLGGPVRVHLGLGSWLIFVALAPLLWAAVRFGVMRRPRVR
jgi:uncharacterized membrane protein